MTIKTTWVKFKGQIRKVWYDAYWDKSLKAGFLSPYIIYNKRRVYLQVPSLA
jgi:hypothetical protein